MSVASVRACLLAFVLAGGALAAACSGGAGEEAGSPFYLRARIVVEDRDELHEGAGAIETRLELWAEGPGRWRQHFQRDAPDALDIVGYGAGQEFTWWDRLARTYERTDFGQVLPSGFFGLSTRLGPTGYDDVEAFLSSLTERASDVPPAAEVVGEEELLGRRTVIVELRPAYVSARVGGGADGPMGDGYIRYWVDPELMFVLREEIDSSNQGVVAEVVELDLDPEFEPGLFDFDPPNGARELPPEP